MSDGETCDKGDCQEPPEWYLTVEGRHPGWYTCGPHLQEAVTVIRENIDHAVHMRIHHLDD